MIWEILLSNLALLGSFMLNGLPILFFRQPMLRDDTTLKQLRPKMEIKIYSRSLFHEFQGTAYRHIMTKPGLLLISFRRYLLLLIYDICIYDDGGYWVVLNFKTQSTYLVVPLTQYTSYFYHHVSPLRLSLFTFTFHLNS